MLHKLFDGNPQLCVYPVDVSLLYAYFPAFTQDPQTGDRDLADRACRVVRHSLRETESELDIDHLVDMFRNRLTGRDLRSRPDVLAALINAWQELAGADPALPVLIKETSQAVFFDLYRAAFPDIRMVNLLRDPRDNYSALKAGVGSYYSKLGEGDRETLASLLNRARMDFHAGFQNAALAPDAFRNLRFEDLVANPRETMRDLVGFLDLPFDEQLLQPTFLGRKFKGNSYEGQSFEGISRVNAGRWRERISEEEAMVIEYWMEAEMKLAGYETSFPHADSQLAFARFYEWYNTRYFFRDAFAGPGN